MRAEPVSDFELDAYVDGELDLPRRFAVEEYLAQNPGAASKVMAELRTRSALTLAQVSLGLPPRALLAAAERLGRHLEQREHSQWLPLRRRLIALAGAAAAVAIALFVPPSVEAKPPLYVTDAVMAYRTNLLRVAMASQIETRTFDPRDVRRYTRIRVPTLPAGWQIKDAQIFPSDEGPALQLLVGTSAGKTVSVFAVRTSEVAPVRPETIRRGNTSIAYWRHGPVAYALVGLDPPDALDVAAEDLADNRLD